MEAFFSRDSKHYAKFLPLQLCEDECNTQIGFSFSAKSLNSTLTFLRQPLAFADLGFEYRQVMTA